MSNSSHEQLRHAILDLFHETLSRYPPPYAPGPEPAGDPPYRLGDYLIYQGYLSPRNLTSAINESLAHPTPTRKTSPLGVTLVNHYNIPGPVLAVTLLLQTMDRLEQTPSLPPHFLGEQLLREAALSPEQLAVVLEEQVEDYAHGQWRRLGDLIANHGWLDAETLSAAVHAVRHGDV
ncbi:hypothetical protein [Candidatus Oscillochloris fontis]|uniref:hypothetical protein n=1 Tax=Candidatus Oscillochloris fontis TaxID=2496868 RepID=UPI00101BB6C4|nr:hypothetical protein [Candidatus Oscillochloris fontis]